MGMLASSIPFKYKGDRLMTLLKGEEALRVRRDVASTGLPVCMDTSEGIYKGFYIHSSYL